MSKTRKGSKSPGYDFWSKRPGSGMGHGRDAKKITHSKERAAGKREEKKSLKELERHHDENDEN